MLEHTTTDAAHTPSAAAKYDMNTLHGFKIPKEPEPSTNDGCVVCVYDLYEKSLKVYKESRGPAKLTCKVEYT
ncbi:hypothetical protein BDQ17DRAFT_1428862 [Cyathus striatus]|nr:hypothetical protein BDQ17DRAFT_1428862 [Cyathus striatus]